MHPQDLQRQVAELRKEIARIDRKYASPATSDPNRITRYIEEWLCGQEVETRFGRHFETEKLYESHRRHGSADIGALADLPEDLLNALSEGAVVSAPPVEWAFLDTETTGVAANMGACAFLVGVGRITPDGFRVRQFFMRDYAEEASLLDALARHLAGFRVMITYNGRSFDQPLLEKRYRFQGVRLPFPRVKHLDLLHGARRLWKLRFESCRLVDLEAQVLGVERYGDLPGALIPYVYFEYLRTRHAARLLPVFHHNATDILTLACLTGIVPHAFNNAGQNGIRHGAEMVGIARWLNNSGERQQARLLFRRAVDMDLADAILFRTLWDLAALERKLGDEKAAERIWNDLAGSKNPFQERAAEALGKLERRRERAQRKRKEEPAQKEAPKEADVRLRRPKERARRA